MTQKCVTWKQPDGGHFNGWCTNRFRLTNPPEDVRVRSGCRICVNPFPTEFPLGCNDCNPADKWPITYTLRGTMNISTALKGLYSFEVENSLGKITSKRWFISTDWAQISQTLSNCLLTRIESDVDTPQCIWNYNHWHIWTFRSHPHLVGQKGSIHPCNQTLNHPAVVSDVSEVQQTVGPQIFIRRPQTTAYMKPINSPLYFRSTDFAGLGLSIPSFTPNWPAGYGDISGTPIQFFFQNTGEPIYPGCLTAGYWFGSMYTSTLQIELRNLWVNDSPPYRYRHVQIVISPSLTNYVTEDTYWDKVENEWVGGAGTGWPSFSPPLLDQLPPVVYGMWYEGVVDCFNKGYVRLAKHPSAPDPLGAYPAYIEINGTVPT